MCIASSGQRWTNGEEWVTGVSDEFKNKNEIEAIINNLSLVKEMFTKSFMKMEEVQIAKVCKVITMKIEDFDEVILVVQVCVGHLEYVKDVLLDGGSNVNIISKSLRKLGLRKPKLAPFVVKMGN